MKDDSGETGKQCDRVARRGGGVLAWLTAIIVVLCAAPLHADSVLTGSTEQGVFQVAGGQATLVPVSEGTWDLRFTLPPGGAAGVWTKSLAPDLLARPAHALRYALTLDSAPATVLPVTWELKGTTGTQTVPLALRVAATRRGEPALEWSRIGVWSEGVLAVAHPGGGEPLSGVIRIQAALVRWPAWWVVLSHQWGRWLGLLLAAALAGLLARLFQGGRRSPAVPRKILRSLTLGVVAALGVFSLAALLADDATRPGQWPLTPAAVTLAGTLMAALLTRCFAGRWPTVGETLRHALLSGLPVFAAGDLQVWSMTKHAGEFIRLSRFGAGVFWTLYLAAHAHRLITRNEPLGVSTGLRLMAVPFLFGLLLLLPNEELMSRAGGFLTLAGFPSCPWLAVLSGRVMVLIVFNAAVALACLGSRAALHARPTESALLPVLALAVSVSPWVADLGSGAWVLSGVWQPVAAIGFTMLSQGALWAEAYVLTSLLLQAMRGGEAAQAVFSGEARLGFRKGVSFSGWFMGLLQAGSLVAASAPWAWAQGQFPVATWAVLGAVVFPLVKTVIETFDGSPSFIRRLGGNYCRSTLPWRGAVLGGCMAWAWVHRGIEWFLPERAGYGFAVGVLVYAGISLLRDLRLSAAGRGCVAGGRVYLVEAVLGGLVGAALGFYLDAAQTPVITNKLAAYLKAGAAPLPYEVYPLLSRWGFLPLGDYTGGARLLWNEALAGVISWGVAAWLFALNRSALFALMQREWAPLRRVFSRQGMTELAEGTIYVLRWGLWMAPIIFTFLRQMPTPTWYNQDGAIRTLCCVWQNLWLDPAAFEAWSLKVFLGVLAYDGLRVLIWLDHMGLRVATLVNLSFLGMEQLDARVARFLGPPATARCFPEGIKRFTTWAPLLLPFYIPAGAAWDQVWTQSQALRLATPPWLERFWGQSLAAGLLEAGVVGAVVFGLMALVRRRPETGVRPIVALQNDVFTFTLHPDGAVRAEMGPGAVEIHRPAQAGRDPAGRAVFMAEGRTGGGWDVWPLLGNFPAEIGPQAAWTGDDKVLVGKHEAHGLQTELRVTLPNRALALEAWTVTVVNPGTEARSVLVVPYVEWLLSTVETDRGHTQYNRLFPEVSYEPGQAALVAVHRLTKVAGFLAADRAPEGFHAERVDFLGRAGTLWAPEALAEGHWRPPAAMAPCPMFDAMGALALRVEIPAGGTHTLRWWVGAAASGEAARAMVKRVVPEGIPVRKIASPGPRLDHGTPPRSFVGHYTLEYPGHTLRVLTPFTPRPFDHTMANRLGHVMSVTQRGLHTSSSVNSQQNRLTPDWADLVTREWPGEAFYLFDPDTGEWFSPTYEPLRDRHAVHDVRFGVDGTAVFRMHRAALSTELTAFVPPDDPLGVYRLVVRNDSDQPRRLVCAAYFEMVLAARPEHAGPLRRGSAAGGRGVWFENPRNTFRSGPAFVAMVPAPDAIVTRRGDFFGPDRTAAHPEWVEGARAATTTPPGRRCPLRGDDQPVAGLRVVLEIPPRSEREVVVVLGQAESLAEAERLMVCYAEPAHVQVQLEATRRWWSAKVGMLEVETSDRGMDGLLPWLTYQALAERLWARKGFYQASGAFGFRDQLQDAVNLIWVDPGLARRQILLHAAQQFIEGDTVHWFFLQQDGRTGLAARSHASDNLLWLAWAVAEYVRMTGDAAVLDERVPYLDTEIPLPPLPAGRGGLGLFPLRSPLRESLFHHVCRALDRVLDHRMGDHGLPLIGTGDWNDSFDEIGVEGRGESVWLGCFLHYILKEWMPLLEARCRPRTVAKYRRAQESLRGALEAVWRGDRYLRAIHDDGTEIGTAGGGAWEVDALTAAWAVMAGLDPGRARTAFDTALRLLDRGPVILLGWPPVLEKTRPRFGRVAQYPAGVRENGMYCHGVQWLVGAARLLAERCEAGGDPAAAAGYRETAARLWRKISPLAHTTPERIEVYGGQPNKQAADLLTEVEPGRMIWSGYTGAAAWMLRQALEGVIGARLEGNQVRMPDDADKPRGDLLVRRVGRRVVQLALVAGVGACLSFGASRAQAAGASPMQALLDNALGYIRPGQGLFDPASGYPCEGWNDDVATGLRLRSFTQLTAIGSWMELLAHLAAGTVETPVLSRTDALAKLEQVADSLLADQRDPRLAERGLLCNFMGFEPARRVGPLASVAHRKDFLDAFGAQAGGAIWQALKERGWLYAWRDDAGAEIRRENGYGAGGFDGALAPYAAPEIREKILAILDQRVVQLVFGDNANLAASAAKAAGILLHPAIRDTTAAARIREKLETFIEAQRPGYAFLYDPQRGLFRFGWNASDRRFVGWGDGDGVWQVGYSDYLVNEFRGPTEFVVVRYGFPVDPVRNLGFRIKSRMLADGRELFTLAPWEGSAFQAWGLSLFMDELSSPGWRAVLENAVRINLDYSRQAGLPGFLSESYSGRGIEYTGRVGIPELAVVNQPPRITNAPSLYTLGVAREILPREVEAFVAGHWQGISALLTDHGPWEGTWMEDGTPIRCQTTAHVMSLILGGLGKGSEAVRRYLEWRGLAQDMARLRPDGERVDFLGKRVESVTWSAQGAAVWGERGWRGYRLHGEAGRPGAVTWTFPAQSAGVSLSNGKLVLSYRNRGPALRAVVRFEGQAATGRSYGNELALRFRATGRKETFTIPLPATPALTSLRQVVLMAEPEAPGVPDLTLVAFRFQPAPVRVAIARDSALTCPQSSQ